MSGVAPGSPVSSANTNQAFIDANGDDATVGRLGLNNSLAVSGTSILNTQAELNSEASFTGKPINSLKDALPTWTDPDAGSPTDNLNQRSEALTVKFNPTYGTGHGHSGVAGDGPQIPAVNIGNVTLTGFDIHGTNIVGAIGGSTDVSSLLIGKVPSTNSTTLGVVVNAPYNNTVLRQTVGASSGDPFLDGAGNEVYGRLTELAGVWTLTYFSLVAGVETAYSFASAETISWFYQELVNPINSPYVYSESYNTPSDNATNDILDASPTQSGKVNTIAQSFGGLKSFVNGIAYTEYIDSTTTGVSANLPANASKWTVLTNGSLSSIASTDTPNPGEIRILTNATGLPISILNDVGSPATNGIITGTGALLTLANTATIILAYDLASAVRWRVVGGSGSGGGGSYPGTNYAPFNGDFNGGVTGWGVFNTAFVNNLPTTITAGSAYVSISNETTAPLEGTGSLKFSITTPVGSNGSGFISDVMTIFQEDWAQVFNPNIFYKSVVGGTNLDFSGSSTQTLEAWVYNVTLATWYQVQNFRGINKLNLSAQLNTMFQTDPLGANNQYQFAIIVRNDPLGAADILFDTFYFGRVAPNFLQIGASAFQKYPLVIGATITAPTLGSTLINSAQWLRNGTKMDISATIYQNAAGTAGSGDYTFSLPSGYSIDLNAAGFYNSENTVAGNCLSSNGSFNGAGPVAIFDAQNLVLYTTSGAVANGEINLVSSTSFPLSNATQIYTFTASVPIVGWTTYDQVQTSPPVVAVYTRTSGGSFAANLPFDFDAKTNDNYGAVTTGYNTWSFLVPVKGFYNVSASMQESGAANGAGFYISKNGAFYVYISSAAAGTNPISGGSQIIECNVGDTLDIRPNVAVNTSQFCAISINQIPNDYNITDGSDVSVKAVLTTSPTLSPTIATVIFDDVKFDYGGNYNSSTGVYTVPVAGTYFVSAGYGSLQNFGQAVGIVVYKNGLGGTLEAGYQSAFAAGGNTTHYYLCTGLVKCNAGDTLSVAGYTDSGFYVLNPGLYSSFCVSRITPIDQASGPAPGGGGGITRSINSVSTNTTAASVINTDYVYLVTGTTTITLPTAVGNTNMYSIKNVDVNPVTIATTGGQMIDGVATLNLPTQYQSYDLISDNANWNIL